MTSQKPATVVAEDPPARTSDGAPDGLGVKEPAVVPPEGAPLGANGTNGSAVKEKSVGRHERNASMSGAFLAAPGHSPSFASLGDTNSFETHHVPRFSDTFEGFEPPRLSHSREVQETPKVARPEGLSFTTPVANEKTPEDFETPQASGTGDSGTTPASLKDPEGEEDYTSPIANLVQKPLADDALPSPSTPSDANPALDNVGSFAFGGSPQTPQTEGALPSPSTPTDAKPGLDNVDSFSFGGTPETPHEPHVIHKKIPGYELLGSFMTMNKNPSTPEDAASSAVVEATPLGHGDVALPQEDLKDPESVVLQPNLDAAEAAQSQPREAPLPEEPPSEKLDSHATDSPVAYTTDAPTTEKSVEASNVATGSEGIGEEVVEKPAGHEAGTTGEKEVGNALPETAPVASAPETFAFRNAGAEKEVPTSATTGASDTKPGPLLGKLTTISTKKWRGPSDVELKKMVVIPDYLSKDMADAVATEGAANPEGAPPHDVKPEAPTCPILVFINSKSGGRLGPELKEQFEALISPNQVYDLSKHSPSAVLRYGVGCLDKLANSGDECARQTRENLRILVAGGDGTVGWCLSSVGELRGISTTDNIPPVGVVPLGTGNDLSRSFGWGGSFSSTSKASVKRCLVKALSCNAAALDTWKTVVMPAKSVAAEDIQFPHAMHPQHHVPLPSSVAGEKHDKDETAPAFEGLFFNYFSVGMDAQVAYGFHHLRDEKPWLARGRTANQMIYSSFGCTQGWFCTTCSMAPRARGVSNVLKLFVRKRGSSSKDWEEIGVPSNIRAIVICNLKSYAGGRNPWGKPSSGTRQKEGLGEQRPDDGLLEVMGLKDGWHSAFVLLEVSTAVRLCQAEAIKLELNGNARRKAYLQMDGEPWMQPMGVPHDEPTVVMIEKLPSPSMLLKR